MLRAIALLVTVFSASVAIQCPSKALDSTARYEVLSFHNILRSSIARGMSTPGPASGKNIYELEYDCNLETTAEQVAKMCLGQASAEALRPGIGENFKRYVGASPNHAALKEAATDWWNEVIKKGWGGAADNVYTLAMGVIGLNNYAQMAWGSTTKLGCGINRCSGYKAIVCHYQVKGAIVGQPMVEPGQGCQQHSECTSVPGSTCSFALRLCKAPTGSLVTTTVATTTTSTTTTADPFAACTGAPLITPGIRSTILQTHNNIREMIARGQLVGGAFTKGCANMFQLGYDCELQQRAQDLADTCRAAAANYPLRRGQNVNFVDGAAALEAGPAIEAAMAAWEAQAANFHVNVKLTATAGDPNELDTVGYFAQMANAKTHKVGCGYSKCTAMQTVVVCYYKAARSDAGIVYKGISANGCQPAKCQATNANATCNATNGLCALP